MCRWPQRGFPCGLPPKKHRRSRGKWGRLSVKLKAKLLLESRTNFDHHGFNDECDYHRLIYWCSLEPAYASIWPIAQEILVDHPIHRMPYLRKGGGVNLQNLWPLCHASQSVGDSILIKMAQVNTRSLCNKMFILRDFFTSKLLDILFVTDTWLSTGDVSHFADLVPSDCTFFLIPPIYRQGRRSSIGF